MTEKNRYQIFNRDAFDWLSTRETKSVQAVVTDPPYSLVEYSASELLKKRNGNGGIWRLPHVYDGYKRNPTPRFTILQPADHRRIEEFHGRLAVLLFRVLVPGGHIMLASNTLLSHLVSFAFTRAGFELRGQIARIVKTLRGGDRPKDGQQEYRDLSVSPRSSWEPWLVFRRPCEGKVRDNLKKWGTGGLRRPKTDVPFRDLIQSSPARGEEKKIAPHPSLKPQAFMRQIVRAAVPLGKGVVLDPFMGAGSTLAAAESLGLRSIGIEIDHEFYNLAKKAIPRLASLVVDWQPK